MATEDTARLDELKKALSNLDVGVKKTVNNNLYDGIDWSQITPITSIDFSSIPSLTTAQIQTLTVSPNTSTSNTVYTVSVGGGGGGGSGGVLYGATPVTTGTTYTYQQPQTWNNTTAGSTKINLDGPEADISINGRSLTKALEALEQRLAILKPNVELEAEWDELRELGERYRALEQHIIEKNRTFDIMKSMPKPETPF